MEIPIHLAGGYGEIRPNHFHTGMDMKTNSVENLKVLSAAEGYISRISISHSGYGNALYVNHPNGYTTVYAHLNDFYPELQKWVIEQQYKEKKWAIQLYPEANQFPVKKGQFIAFSGNTGGSTGPHLHFEIRNTESEFVVNSMLFGLPYQDNLAPVAEGLAVYDASQSIFNQNPTTFSLISKGHQTYAPKVPLIELIAPEVYFGIQAKDYMNGSNNWMGIYRMKLFVDNVLHIETVFNELDFSLNRYANAYYDYKTQRTQKRSYQLLHQIPGNQLNVYSFSDKRSGKLNFTDNLTHAIRIELYDPKGNQSEVKFLVKYKGFHPLFDLKPKCKTEETIYWNCLVDNDYSDSVFSFKAPVGALYDHLCFKVTAEQDAQYLTDMFQVMDNNIPIQKECEIALKLNQELPENLHSKIAFVHHVKSTHLPGNNPQHGMAAQYDNGWAKAKIRTFGNYYCVIDSTAPTIKPLQTEGGVYGAGQTIRFQVKDNLTAITSFEGLLNGQKWLRFSRRGHTFSYQIDEHCPKGRHFVKVLAKDENGNESVLEFSFTRK